jgi:hypothetical protein
VNPETALGEVWEDQRFRIVAKSLGNLFRLLHERRIHFQRNVRLGEGAF